jgi:lipopolysaccharide transport system permease protein
MILWQDYFINFLLLCAGMLCAIWLRLKVVFGLSLGAEYQSWPLSVTVILLFSVAVGYGFANIVSRHPRAANILTPQRKFRVLMTSAMFASIAILILSPDVSQLQLVYFIMMTAIIGIFIVVYPGQLRSRAYVQLTIASSLHDLFKHRHLLFIWLRYRIEARYRQTLLGIIWIVLLPLSTALVLSFAFTQLLGAGQIMNVPFVAFILSGQVIFSIFQSSIMGSNGSVVRSMGLIKKVYFPREILILLLVGETIVDFMFALIATIIILTVVYGIPPNIYYLLLPVPALIMIIMSTGLALLIGWFSIVIRDLQQLLGVLMQLLFFATIFYAPGRVASPDIARIMALNPLAAIVVAFRDILLYGQSPDWVSLYLPGVLSVVFLYLGYIVFKANEDRFVDMA